MSISTYSNNPENRPIDEVRLLVGDTDIADFDLSDAEIQYFITNETDATAAAIAAAETLVARFAKLVDTTIGQISKSYSQRVESYKKLIETLKEKIAEDTEVGIDDYIDTDPLFTIGMFDNVNG